MFYDNTLCIRQKIGNRIGFNSKIYQLQLCVNSAGGAGSACTTVQFS